MGAIVIAGALLAAGCGSEPSPSAVTPNSRSSAAVRNSSAPPAVVPPTIRDLPVELTVKQRTTTAVPGSHGAVRVTIDDITRGQVMVSIAGEDGGVLLAPISLAANESATFKLGDEPFKLTLKELSNALVGDDFCTFVISAVPQDTPAAGAMAELTEIEKIERLIARVGSMDDAKFLRNGSEYGAKDAADHLRSKWQSSAGDVRTARQFIDQIATKSSLSGEPYRIRMSSGAVVPAGDYLREQLAEIEGNG